MLNLIGLMFIMTAGYAAFNTVLKITAKGNVYSKSELCYQTSDNGDETVSITSYDESCGTDVAIPSTIKGKTVSTIADGEGWNGNKNDAYSKNLGAFANREITSISFPETLTYVGNFAFFNNKLTEVKMSNNITHIGNESFKNNQIAFIEYSKNLKTIGTTAFSTNHLTSIEVPSTVTTLGGGAYAKNKVSTGSPYVFGRKSDGSDNLEVLNSYTSDGSYLPEMPNTIKIIDEFAFRDCYFTTSFTLPNGIETIYHAAFGWVYSSSITIPSSIKTIDSNAFFKSNYTKINIDRKEGSIAGAPWGAINTTVNWTGTN